MPMNSWEWVHFHHNADASTWYGDSFAWIRVGLQEDRSSGRGRERSGSNIDHHRLNVALVSAGTAIELIYKVLLIADRVKTKSTHSIRKLHWLLEARKSQVEDILLEEGWSELEFFLDFMDNDLRHWDRKYWMSDPPKKHAGMNFAIANGPRTVPSLAHVHNKMAALVDVSELVAQYSLEHARVVITQALTADPIVGHKTMAIRRLRRDGEMAEYTVYESVGPSWHVNDYERGWWEMPQESGEPTGRFVYLLNPGEYDTTVDYTPS